MVLERNEMQLSMMPNGSRQSLLELLKQPRAELTAIAAELAPLDSAHKHWQAILDSTLVEDPVALVRETAAAIRFSQDAKVAIEALKRRLLNVNVAQPILDELERRKRL
jgi:hypothetical protein